MPPSADAYELPARFYLGRPVDPDTGKPVDDTTPFLYDASDLTTHAICVGMTGSGKTGLGIALLEEAAIDGIPALVIDPKGDLTNLALQFPNLAPEDFRPWVSPEIASREGQSLDQYAASQAELWRAGLEKSGESGERIARLQRSAEVTVYTPGSTAGIPVALVQSLDAPADVDDPELLGMQIETTVASLLGLLGIKADPVRSREGVLLSAILRHHWDQGQSLDLPTLGREIQTPPFQQVGMLDTEAFYPSKDRFQLVLALNNLLASPSFAVWREGAPLDIQRLLYTPEGKPRLAVFSIAHLGDGERMFFVSMLLGATLSWMRRQQGTSSLRALLYMDEIFGYFPPTENPPSKKPLLTLMKQARAFGLGVVLATQNPADLDYKGLSNAGTWFIGRLQTERDKMRLLDGLAGLGVDRGKIDRMLSALGKRMFLMNNVHEDAPILFSTRWTLSYLCGPLTREQIRQLPRPAAAPETARPAAREIAPEAKQRLAPPPVVTGIPQVYPKDFRGEALYPVLIGAARVRYRDLRMKVDCTRAVALAVPFPNGLDRVDWSGADPITLDDFDTRAPANVGAIAWGEVPPEGLRKASYTGWEKEFTQWATSEQRLTLLECPLLKMISGQDETEGAFRERIALPMREARDAAMEKLRDQYAKKEAALSKALTSAEERLRVAEARAGEGRMQMLISAGSTLLSLFLGRRKLSATTISKATTTARSASRTMQQGDTVESVKARRDAAQEELTALETTLRGELDALEAQYDARTIPLEPREIAPMKTGSRVELLALGWIS